MKSKKATMRASLEHRAALEPPRTASRRRARPRSASVRAASLFATVFTSAALTAMQKGPQLVAADSGFWVDGVVGTAECYEPLIASDLNGDRRVNSTEYIYFLNGISDDYFHGMNTYADLPLVLKENYVLLACECVGSNCCVADNAHISTAGAASGETPTDEEAVYLYLVCRDTFDAVDRVVTQAPTSTPTEKPSKPPSNAPTAAPTTSPTSAPSVVPSPAPSPTPSERPSASAVPSSSVHTAVPSMVSSPTPSRRPSASAVPSNSAQTSVPSVAPSVDPTDGFSDAPSMAPWEIGGIAPTYSPTRAPTDLYTGDLAVQFQYEIGNTGFTAAQIDSTSGNTIEQDLLDGTDELVPEIVQDVFSARRMRQRQRRRNLRAASVVGETPDRIAISDASLVRARLLEVAYNSNAGSTIDAITDIECPNEVADGSFCALVTSTTTLSLTEEDKDAVEADFKEALDAAIDNGVLLEKVSARNSAVIYIGLVGGGTTRLVDPPTDDDDSSGGMSSGAVAGIAVAAAAVGVFVVGGFLMRRRRREKDVDLQPFSGEASDDLVGSVGDEEPMLGASSPDYGKKRKKPVQELDTMSEDESYNETKDKKEHDPSLDMESSVASSSYAGSSGWSSSAGLSSMNTESVDDEKYNMSTLAAIGAASGVSGRIASSEERLRNIAKNDDDSSTLESAKSGSGSSLLEQAPDIGSDPVVTRADVESAIQAGDWAAVGATAALLANASDSASFTSSRSRTSSSFHSTGSALSALSSVDAARAAELDKLVDAGDWEGVVLAAAKFETASEGETGSKSTISQDRTDSHTDVTDPNRSTASIGTSSVYSPSAGSVSESPSKAQKRAEIRTEVEALVRRVVPDEIDNVDEMMEQFSGREEELVETLRTMQERSIAQRARAAVRKTAKREARDSARAANANGVQPQSNGGGVSAGAAAAVGAGAAGAAALTYGAVSRNRHGSTTSSTGGSRSTEYESTDTFSDPHFESSTDVNRSSMSAGGYGADLSKSSGAMSTPISDDGDAETSGISSFTTTGSSTDIGSGSKSTMMSSISGSSERRGATSSSLLSGSETTGSSKENSKSSTSQSYSQKYRRSLGASDENKGYERSALELAIEAGDWEAVGEAAAMMSDTSVTTASTNEILAVAAGEYDSSITSKMKVTSSSSDHSTSGMGRGKVSASPGDRAAQLEQLIDKGDWTGVVAAASRFNSADSKQSSRGSVSSSGRSSKSSGSKRHGEKLSPAPSVGVAVSSAATSWTSAEFGGKPVPGKGGESLTSSGFSDKDTTKEEQDALAQAEIWMAIAAQSRQDGTKEPHGASDAADWAISRSLSALHSADGRGRSSGQNSRRSSPRVSSASSLSSKGDGSV